MGLEYSRKQVRKQAGLFVRQDVRQDVGLFAGIYVRQFNRKFGWTFFSKSIRSYVWKYVRQQYIKQTDKQRGEAFMNLLWIGIGGIFGAWSRYYLGLLLSRRMAYFPLGTFVINLSGSLLLGVLYAMHTREMLPDSLWLLLGVGVCGAYTTFSTFGLETIRLLEKRRYAAAAGYVVGSVTVGIAAAWLGTYLGD
jgi:CrcB protein